MATYYVDTNAAAGGNGTTSGLTGAHCAWDTIADVNAGATDDDIVYLRRGCTWAERLRPANAGSAGHVITIDVYGAGAAPKITGNGTHCYYADKSYVIINRIEFSGTGFGVNMASSATNLILNYCIIRNTTNKGFAAAAANTAILNNCIIAGTAVTGVYVTGAGADVALKNCMILGNCQTSGYGLQRDASGTLTYTNCLISGNGNVIANNISAGCTDGGGNLVEIHPGIVSYKTNAVYACLASDDHDVAYWKDISTTIASWGAKFTVFLIASSITGAEETDISDLAASGHEMAVHGWSHSDLALTTAFAVTSTNTSPTVNVDPSTSTIVFYCTEAGNRVTVDWSAADKSITDVKAAVAGKGWTITTTIGIVDTLKMSSCGTSAGAQACPYTVTLDVSSGNGYPFWREEITDTATWIGTKTGVTPVTMAYPGGTYTAGLKTYLATTAIIGARIAASVPHPLSSIDIYGIKGITSSTIKGDGTEAVVRANTRHFYEYCKSIGGVMVLYTHSAAEFSLDQIGWYVDEIYDCGGTVVTFKDAVTAIRADHSTVDNITYTKTYTDVSDFHLLPNSLCINAGTDVGLTTDYEGNTVPVGAAQDIGAYEFQATLLVAAEGAQTQVSDTPTVVVTHVLAADEGAQPQVADTPTVVCVHVLAADEGLQAQESETPTVTESSPSIDLFPAEGLQTQASDAPALTQVHNLVVAEGAQAQESDSPALSQTHNIGTAEGAQVQSTDTPTLSQTHNLGVAEGAQAQASDTPNLTQILVVAPVEGAQAQASDEATLDRIVVLMADEGAQEQLSDAANSFIQFILAVQEGRQEQISDVPALTQLHKLITQEGNQTSESDLARIVRDWVKIGLNSRTAKSIAGTSGIAKSTAGTSRIRG